ncbi:C-type lectin domain family 4 member E-like protein [Leptotrombidium deliense]|uniref:C-type lectin domain family 4 member E-like protein n=1 Tax=Leptotrombidium deliense TaxID=299467 RepID=A0A443RUX2_9ACAR|nr:C-type lectin domain family 4 member E-like protein [Leptotrombidium deliense]
MIESEAENEFIGEKFAEKYWLGVRYPKSENFMKIKSEYIRFTKWGKSEPNNYRENEYCIETANSEWNDVNCYEQKFGICEKPIGIGVNIWNPWSLSNCFKL